MNIYIAPLQAIYSEALSALSFMMLNVVMNEYVQTVCKTKNNKMKESPMAGPRTHVEPAKCLYVKLHHILEYMCEPYLRVIELKQKFSV